MADTLSSSTLIDQTKRDRFCHELQSSFSVLAPAGVGKTRAITERIVNLARSAYAKDHSLIVVTYTRKAAQEMEERVRDVLTQESCTQESFQFLNSVFWGTIHSFAYDLVCQYGYYLGIPTKLELVDNDDVLWTAFFRAQISWDAFWPQGVGQVLSQYISIKDLGELARGLPCVEITDELISKKPIWDPKPLLSFTPTKRNQEKVDAGKVLLREFLEALDQGQKGLSIPEYNYGGKDFKDLWEQTFRPLKDWVAKASLITAKNVSDAYRAYRLSQLKITYDDITTLALDLLKDSKVGPLIRSKNYAIILDEAQDTDVEQFRLLLELARPANVKDFWLDAGGLPPQPGRFCMVGDPQQSIYGGRADLSQYRDIHNRLISEGAVTELTFQVTMRCQQSIVKAVNEFFPSILKSSQTQVDFVPLQASPWSDIGEVVRLPVLPAESDDLSLDQKFKHEAIQLANWLVLLSPDKLGVDDWKDVAFLCPRKRWLIPLAKALKDVGFAVQIHSRDDKRGENPAFSWMVALLTIINEPNNAFEICGVLREVFGVSDHDLACFVHEQWVSKDQPHPLQINVSIKGDSFLIACLNRLNQLREQVKELPLRDIVVQVIQSISLRERLRVLDQYDLEEMYETLDSLCWQAVAAEGEGLVLSTWLEHLQRVYEQPQEEVPVHAGHIQLYTCHKSKGLEWPVVIVPFLFRELKKKSLSYPRAIKTHTGNWKVLLGKGGLSEQDQMLDSAKQQAEFERLLYVTCTRPKQTLILVDDESLWAATKSSTGSSLGSLLRVGSGDMLAEIFQKLPITTSATCVASKEKPTFPSVEEIQPYDPTCEDQARLYASQYPRRVLPSSLANHDSWEIKKFDNDLTEDESVVSIGPDYGNWFHAMMEHMPWGNAKAWPSHCKKRLEQCPLSDRGQKEIELFLASTLAKQLFDEDCWVRPEVPFIWKASDEKVFEGFIDLAIYFKKRKQWLIVDWKTDAVPEGLEGLKRLYAPQIQLYVDATNSYWKQATSGLIYSTRLGECVHV